jgi:RNA polymerase sigma-70 factor (ECF subfamily)
VPEKLGTRRISGNQAYVDMDMETHVNPTGRFEARYLAFLETVSQLRPKHHRYCARMTGSVLDGEDVVQDTLFEADRKLDQFDDSRSLSPWLFRIAHNRCIDFLRSRGARNVAESEVTASDSVPATEPASLGICPAIEHLVCRSEEI